MKDPKAKDIVKSTKLGDSDITNNTRRIIKVFLGIGVAAFLLLTVLGISFVVFLGKVKTHSVYGRSMEPAFSDGEYIVGLRVNPANLNRGDVIVYTRDGFDFVSRIVGLPGDAIRIEDGQLYINGELENSDHYSRARRLFNTEFIGKACEADGVIDLEVPEDSIYVISDNRANSLDSRVNGPVEFEDIKDRIRGCYWKCK